mmetsp:Transcript_32146/g.70144  ORF Transcript_32146/g.70144 Transcript_32146/m.70144 type:complete len:90 (+) Transcript_32146:240-509(+)
MSRFMSQGGTFGGEDQQFYPLAAQFLERLRIKQKQPKSKKRKTLEEESGSRPGGKVFLGMNLDKPRWCLGGEQLHAGKDHLGRDILKLA